VNLITSVNIVTYNWEFFRENWRYPITIAPR